MEIKGIIINVGEPLSGVSSRTGNKWMTQDFVIETEEQYPHRCSFSIFGENRLQEAQLAVGQRVVAHLSVDAREYNGRWYNEISCWKVEHVA